MDSKVLSGQIMTTVSVKAGQGNKSHGKSLDFLGNHIPWLETSAVLTPRPSSIPSKFVRRPKLLISGKTLDAVGMSSTYNTKAGSIQKTILWPVCQRWTCPQPCPMVLCLTHYIPSPDHCLASHFLHYFVLGSLGSHPSPFQFNICHLGPCFLGTQPKALGKSWGART